MPETPYVKFRLRQHYLDCLDDLAASNDGNRSAALRDAIAYWHYLIEDAGILNAEDLSPEDWTRLAHLNDPDPMPPEIDDEGGPVVVDWSARLAHELIGMWEGRAILPLHRDEVKACKELAKRISKWGPIRGYALFACLRHFWRHPDSGVGGGDWWTPETWMTATVRTD